MTDMPTTIAAVAEAHDADILGYFGDISATEDDWLYRVLATRRRRKNVILILTTRGGDPHVAYRIARCLQTTYKTVTRKTGSPPKETKAEGKFTVLNVSRCKSAGTIIALGANEIWMTPSAQFGPIDVQIRKPDEVGERTSGLTPMQAMSVLENQSLGMFKRHFAQLRFSEDLLFSTKMAADIATHATIGLLGPIFSQIDPMRLAEVDRSLRISAEYGERLGGENLHDGALERLLAKYPAHGFVIDRMESAEIFKKITDPPDNVREMAEFFAPIGDLYLDGDDRYFYFLSQELPEEKPEPPAPEGAKGKPKKEE
jgi:hypothetical protein